MATTMFFGENLKDQKKEDASVFLEFGRSSFYGNQAMYIRTSEGLVILDRQKASELFEAMESLALYLDLTK